MVNMFKKKKHILCLGGGAARGLCSIGVLKVLEREFEVFPFDMIIGTSIGALIGGAYCVGTPLSEIEDIAMEFSGKKMMSFKLSSTGILNSNHLQAVIKRIETDG